MADTEDQQHDAAHEAGADKPETTESLQHDLAEMKDRVLRSQAELENVRRRAQREVEEERRYGNVAFIRDLLPALDNIDRALTAAEKVEDSGAGLLTGFRMVRDQIHAALKNHHCVEIAAEGEPFDPNFHEAILQQPSADHAPGTIIGVAQAGYRLHDRVIRPSQVIVATQPPA